jgi:hypothetical protein
VIGSLTIEPATSSGTREPARIAIRRRSEFDAEILRYPLKQATRPPVWGIWISPPE